MISSSLPFLLPISLSLAKRKLGGRKRKDWMTLTYLDHENNNQGEERNCLYMCITKGLRCGKSIREGKAEKRGNFSWKAFALYERMWRQEMISFVIFWNVLWIYCKALSKLLLILVLCGKKNQREKKQNWWNFNFKN